MKTQLLKWMAQKLRTLRESHQYTLDQVADQLDMMKPTYRAYEDERAMPALHTICKLCNFYDMNLETFFSDIPITFDCDAGNPVKGNTHVIHPLRIAVS